MCKLSGILVAVFLCVVVTACGSGQRSSQTYGANTDGVSTPEQEIVPAEEVAKPAEGTIAVEHALAVHTAWNGEELVYRRSVEIWVATDGRYRVNTITTDGRDSSDHIYYDGQGQQSVISYESGYAAGPTQVRSDKHFAIDGNSVASDNTIGAVDGGHIDFEVLSSEMQELTEQELQAVFMDGLDAAAPPEAPAVVPTANGTLDCLGEIVWGINRELATGVDGFATVEEAIEVGIRDEVWLAPGEIVMVGPTRGSLVLDGRETVIAEAQHLASGGWLVDYVTGCKDDH